MAFESPSIANGTPERAGLVPRTNVIKGCTDATASPALLRDDSSLLPSAPLEWNANRTARSFGCFANNSATCLILPSGTASHMISDANDAFSIVTARAPTARASFCARFIEAGWSRATISAMVNPARFSAGARKLANLPAPTRAMLPLRPGVRLLCAFLWRSLARSFTRAAYRKMMP